jgi:hypothetical protein
MTTQRVNTMYPENIQNSQASCRIGAQHDAWEMSLPLKCDFIGQEFIPHLSDK